MLFIVSKLLQDFSYICLGSSCQLLATFSCLSNIFLTLINSNINLFLLIALTIIQLAVSRIKLI